jgi:hypothetical protein
MLISHKIIKTGNFLELYTFQNPIIINEKKPISRQEKAITDGLSEKQKIEYREHSTNRALGKIRRLILGNMNNYEERPKFITLTFDPSKHAHPENLDYVNYEFKKFRQRLSYSTDRHLDYVTTIEQHENGNWHYHALFFNLPFMEYKQFETDIWQNGYTNMKAVNKTMGAFRYITKYLSKAFGNPALENRRRYFQTLSNQPEQIVEPARVMSVISSLDGQPPSFETVREVKNATTGELYQTITKKEYLLLRL